jgi:hypothetical protein
MKSGNLLAAFLISVILCGCTVADRDWIRAKSANTTSAYKDFLSRYPEGKHVDEARAAVDELDWKTAQAANSTSGYEAYLSQNPFGMHVVEADAAIDDFDWKIAKDAGSAAAYTDYLLKHLHGAHSPEANNAILQDGLSDLFNTKTPIAKRPLELIGLLHFVRFHDENQGGIFEVQGGFGTFTFLMDNAGEECLRHHSGEVNWLRVKGVPTGRARYSDYSGWGSNESYILESPVRSFNVNWVRVPELKVENCELTQVPIGRLPGDSGPVLTVSQ